MTWASSIRFPQGSVKNARRRWIALISNGCSTMVAPRRCNSVIVNKCDRTFAVASLRPALIGKTVETIVPENEMAEQSDVQEVSSLPQPCGESSILRTQYEISPGGWL